MIKYWSTPHLEDKMAAPGWTTFIQRITKHSGKHIHQGGVAIYIVDGKGYSIVDGVRYDWEAGDLIILPFKPGGVEHQHFNKEPDRPSHWIALIFHPWFYYTASHITQVETHPDWVGRR